MCACQPNTLGGDICMNVVVCMGKLLPPTAQFRTWVLPGDLCSSHSPSSHSPRAGVTACSCYTPGYSVILCDCISGLFSAETVGFSLELPSALFLSEFVGIAGSAWLRFAVDFVLLKPRPIRAGLAFAVFPTENVS